MGQSQGYQSYGYGMLTAAAPSWIPSDWTGAASQVPMPCGVQQTRPPNQPMGDSAHPPQVSRQTSVQQQYQVHNGQVHNGQVYGGQHMGPMTYVMPPFPASGPRLPISPRSSMVPSHCNSAANSVAVSPSHKSPRSSTMQAASNQCALSEEVLNFLTELGFEYYQEAFRKNGFEDLNTVMAMSQEDMRNLGMLPGHVLKLDMKIDQLCEQKGRPRRGKAALQLRQPRRPAMIQGAAPAPQYPADTVFRKQIVLSPVASRTPSPVEKNLQEISAGWTDGREWAVATVDEGSEH
eukprot:CAMPEP_0181513998 /NCGR_PEP_ID=MMETSP1110-20121109/62798_1 /TAXON_ID=174948 /ORGANISM="Symbiodinium sp., Strain CCMP421" /LENGTH=291 /DNA_ID=CAMNT_0023643903 /DNA_START=48 /DNA_END=920 /DNA_ORIENTATION=+